MAQDKPIHVVERMSTGDNPGIAQPRDVAEDTPMRNQRDDKRDSERPPFDHAQGRREPVMPADDSTLNTKI